ncbi:MAG: glycine-rich domain-containing protein, partial [Halioglobus sp.]
MALSPDGEYLYTLLIVNSKSVLRWELDSDGYPTGTYATYATTQQGYYGRGCGLTANGNKLYFFYNDSNTIKVYSLPVATGTFSAGTPAVAGSLANTGILSLSEALQASYGVAAAAPTAYIVVAGGGAGGHHPTSGAGGGGAGGVLSSADAGNWSGTYTITVGAGGAAPSTAGNKGQNGGNSSIVSQAGASPSISVTAIGGGAGASYLSGHRDGSNGGSGGGAYQSIGSPGSGTAGQGNSGGNGTGSSGGGGGGAGAAGTLDGGDGVTDSLLDALSHGELSGGNYYVAG